MSYGKAKSYGPNGCGKCGETKTLNILNEFKSLYEKRMEQLEEEARAGGDCLQAKLHLQEQWIKDLMEQNEMMARAVEQLEVEATERVQMLEEKLQSSARCICEKEEEIQEQGRKISDLTKKTDKVDKFGEPEELLGLLKKKEEDFNELKQSMVDMRKALTEEVASKHDMICALKRDIQQLEEQCLQADKQTAFKEDIIKELRKEIKQLKQQIASTERNYLWCSNLEKNSALSPRNNTEVCLNRKKSEESPFITINHMKSEHQANSTVIFIHKHNNRSKKEKNEEDKEQDEYSLISMPSHKPNKRTVSDSIVLNKKYEDTLKNNELSHKNNARFSKSENDIEENSYDIVRPVKEKTKYTLNLLGKAGNSSIQDMTEQICNQKKLDIPNHIPVKMYVNNLESLASGNRSLTHVED